MRENNIVGLTLRLPENLKNQIAEQAEREKRSLNNQIIHLLEMFLRSEKSKPKRSAALSV